MNLDARSVKFIYNGVIHDDAYFRHVYLHLTFAHHRHRAWMYDQTAWERVLWKDQVYPDNHVPRSFLSSLSKNRALHSQSRTTSRVFIVSSQRDTVYLLATCGRIMCDNTTSVHGLTLPGGVRASVQRKLGPALARIYLGGNVPSGPRALGAARSYRRGLDC